MIRRSGLEKIEKLVGSSGFLYEYKVSLGVKQCFAERGATGVILNIKNKLEKLSQSTGVLVTIIWAYWPPCRNVYAVLLRCLFRCMVRQFTLAYRPNIAYDSQQGPLCFRYRRFIFDQLNFYNRYYSSHKKSQAFSLLKLYYFFI